MYSKMIRFGIIFFLILTFVMSYSINIIAQDSVTRYYTLDADNISYHDNIVSASGNVIFKTEGLTVKTDKISIEINKNKLTTLSNKFLLTTDKRELRGERLIYNYEKRTGKFYNAETKIDEFNFEGEEIELVEEKDYEIFLSESSFTKCILDDPHYKITAERIKVFPNNKIVADNILFWWGNAKLFYLPSYVMEYEIDEETGEETVSSGSPVPRIGYNSKDGIVFELDYPYEITDNSTGKAYMNVVQRGSQLYTLEHTHRFNEKTVWNGNYSHDKDVEELDSGGEDITLEKDFNSRLSYDYNSNLTFFNDYNYNSERENKNDPDLNKEISGGFNYNKNALTLISTIGYDYILKSRSESIDITYQLPYSHTFKSKHDFREEKLEKESYNIYSSGKAIDYSLKYRKGYDIDYLPYLDLDFNEKYNIKTDIGFGIVKEGETNLKKARLDLGYNNRFEIHKNLYFKINEKYIHHIYQKEHEEKISNYKGLLSTLTLGTNFDINNRLDLGASLGWSKNITKGDYLISDDEINEKNNLNYNINSKIKTQQPQSHLYLGNSGQYDLKDQEWEELKINLTRKLDCHSFSFSYEIIENAFTIEFSIF